MATEDPQSELVALECLMNEFYLSDSSNVRKQEIELILQHFNELPAAWKSALYFVSHSHNVYVQMFCLNHLETLITKKWLGLNTEDRAVLKNSLYELIIGIHQTSPKFFRNKLVKLVVLIARIDWPHFYPDFFTNILRLIQNPESTVLGLVFLQIASEELVCPWDDLSASRKDDLKRYFLLYIPEVFSVISALLDNMVRSIKKRSATTPPPSPTHGQPAVHSDVLNSMMDSNCIASNTLNADYNAICCATVVALTHIFSWVPLNSEKVSPIVMNLFKLANIIPSCTSDEEQCVGTLSLTALTEIMFKIFMPATCRSFLLNVIMELMNLVTRLIRANDWNKVNRSYVEKVNEFLLQFVKSHLHRVEDDEEFPSSQFLELLFLYTFRQNSLEHYFRCLDIWNTFISSLSGKATHISRYNKVIVTFAGEVLKQAQFSQNQDLLEGLDDETPNADGHTDLDNFLHRSMDILFEVTQLMPMETFNLMKDMWSDYVQVYLNLHTKINTQNHVRHLLLSEDETVQLHLVLRDLAAFTRLVGNMDPLSVVSSKTYAGNSDVHQAEYVVGYVRIMAVYAAEHKFHRQQVASSKLTADFIELHVQLLEALRPWCTWISRLSEKPSSSLYEAYVENVLWSTVPLLLDLRENIKVQCSAGRLLVQLIREVKPISLWSTDPFGRMFVEFHKMKGLPREIRGLVYEAIYTTLLLPWRGALDQNWPARQNIFTSFVSALTAEFKGAELTSTAQHEMSQEIICNTLTVLSNMINNMRNGSTISKKILCEIIQIHLEKALTLLSIYMNVPHVSKSILDFFVAVFGSLQQQLGVDAIGNIIQMILQLFIREQQNMNIRGDENGEFGASTQCIQTFLVLLKLVMSEPGQAFNRFIGSTITFCLENVYPEVSDSPSPIIRHELFTVFHAILLNKWSYFYPCSLKRFGETDYVKNEAQFLSILEAYGKTMLQPDINIFKHNLSSLEELNDKRNLYNKKVFVKQLWPVFLTALLNCLINKTHALLDDEIRLAIFNMSSVNFTLFHNQFLRKFLAASEGLDDGQRNILHKTCATVKDAPSFIQNIQRLVNDLRCYRICNYSLPTRK